MTKRIVYVDMDGVLVDLVKSVQELHGPDADVGEIVDWDADCFYAAPPIDGAVDAFRQLSGDPRFDVYILSTAPWENPESLMAKRVWADLHLGEAANRRLILTHNKQLLMGDYLIDDRDNNGAAEFTGEHIKFGTDKFKTWKQVIDYLTKNS